MKLLFLHLSDIHCHYKVNNNKKLDAIVESMNYYNPDEVIAVCSGDLSFSGQENEFKAFRHFWGTLLSKLGKKFDKHILSLLVPGNHDIFYENGLPSSDDIKEMLSENNETVNYYNELDKLFNFYSYSRSKGCFAKEKAVDIIFKNFGGTTIQFNLINTAPFSTSKSDNKESHYLPEDEIQKLNKSSKADIAVSIMHHGPEWFCYKTKSLLENNLFNNTDILFQGHEHYVETLETERHDGRSILIIKGGEYSGTYSQNSTFSTLLLNTDDLSCTEAIFTWNCEKTIFEHSTPKNYTLLVKPSSETTRPNLDFINTLIKDNNDVSNTILDYFTFPKLTGKNANERIIVESSDELFSLIKTYKTINIRGRSRSGKSSLLKALYKESIDRGYQPLFLYEDNMQNKINTLAKNLFVEQYSDNSADYNRFEYLDKSNKIIFIDDFNSIKSDKQAKALLNYCSENFGHIVFTSEKAIELNLEDNACESVLSELKDSNSILQLIINDFYKKKRTQLINNILSSNSKFNSVNKDILFQNIDYLVNKKYGLFELIPEFIIQYVKFFTSKENENRKDSVFNEVFDTNIRNQIINNSKKYQVEDNFMFLEEIAYNMHFVLHSETVNRSEIDKIAEECKNSKGIDVDVPSFISSMSKGSIFNISTETSLFRFNNINYLAYFAARKLNKLIEQNGYDCDEVVQVLNYICYGINDNVILFLMYFRSNIKFTLSLCKKVNDSLADIEELNFQENNIPFLKKVSDKAHILNQKEKNDAYEIQEKREKDIREIQSEELSIRRLYDYPKDVEQEKQIILRSIKYLEIISKSFVSLFNEFSIEQKKIIISTIYTCPNKVLFYLLKPYEEKFDKVFEQLKNYVHSLNIDVEKEFPNDKLDVFIKRILISTANDLCLNIYDNYACFAATKKTLKFLNDFELRNKNDELFNLILVENGDNTDEFILKAVKLFENSNDPYLKYLIRRVANKHLLVNQNVTNKQIDLLNSKIFSENRPGIKNRSKVQLLMAANKKQTKKRLSVLCWSFPNRLLFILKIVA